MTPAPLSLEGNWKIVAAVFLGLAFGALLQLTNLHDRKTVIKALTLESAQIIKTFLFSISCGIVLFFIFHYFGFVEIHYYTADFYPVVCGAIIAGLGLACCSLTPETSLVSLAHGELPVVWSISGMLLAIPALSFVVKKLSKTIYDWKEPVSYHESFDKYFRIDSPVWYVAAGCLLLMIILHLAVKDSDKA